MSEEAKRAADAICRQIASGKVIQQAIEIAVDLHQAGAVSTAIEEIRKESNNAVS